MNIGCYLRKIPYQFSPKGYRLVLINTCLEHNLAAGGEYNKRRQSCEREVEAIAKRHPEVKLLRDANLDFLKEVKAEVDAVYYTRARKL